ncbi:hypothetical protein CDD82_6782 [Ophiocordyceps australis]|uniref:non-specific serine/threonine protein kinase n=1 Tax=Ophiocordyceps australis TaxID=1399860 RepID=A0A2C5YVF3_9HYPO|nr:hypothetical protein CDD82_6782 [Ophiocordyceps australis]
MSERLLSASEMARSKTILDNPIGNGLDNLRSTFNSVCNDKDIPQTLASLDLLNAQSLTLDLLLALLSARASRLLPSATKGKNIWDDLSRLLPNVNTDNFNLDHIKPLLRTALADKSRDDEIWGHVYRIFDQHTPPQSLPTPIHQTPWTQNTGSIVNSSELRQNVDPLLKAELENLYVGLPNFCKTFFGDHLDQTSKEIFRTCTQGQDPLFQQGWNGWPADAKESHVLAWLDCLIPKLEALAAGRAPDAAAQRHLLTRPRTPLEGSVGRRSLDIGFVETKVRNSVEAQKFRYNWSHVLVPGELKSNSNADIESNAWLDIAKYAREVLAAQDTRRFVLAFTLCGSLMRIWEFDRVGGIASEQFDINTKDGGLQFVTAILGFLWMSKESLGFDSSIMTCSSDNQRFIEIQRDGQTERLIIDEVLGRSRCIAGRATTCWRAHRKDDPKTPLVIKDSWQYTDRDQEGMLLQEAAQKGVVNVARYYHHETVRVNGTDDDIQSNIRKNLDVTKAANYGIKRLALPPRASASGPGQSMLSPRESIHEPGRSMPSPQESVHGPGPSMPSPQESVHGPGPSMPSPQGGIHGPSRAVPSLRPSLLGPGRSMLSPRRSISSPSRKGFSIGVKRASADSDASLPPPKRSCSGPRSKTTDKAPPNRVHRRVIVRDFGKPIYKASSRVALLRALEACIQGHESLHKAGILHRDISINNLMINEDEENCSFSAFLIDLDLAIKEQRDGACGAKGKTGTRAFMAIGALAGDEVHSFMHDLESFFWVLFWICVHYDGQYGGRVVEYFDHWNYIDTSILIPWKCGIILNERWFFKAADEYFTEYYRPLIPWVERLRRIVFPGGEPWVTPDTGLYSSMRELLRLACEDEQVACEDDTGRIY